MLSLLYNSMTSFLKPRYKIVIFDFDNTLCNINTFIAGIKPGDINEKRKSVIIFDQEVPISRLFNDYDMLLILFNDLKTKGVRLCIASFGNINVINKMLGIAFPRIFDYILTSDNISYETNSIVPIIFRHIVDVGCPNFYGKNIMIKRIMDKFSENDPSNVLFFDDDKSNSHCSQQLNVNFCHNKKSGITFGLLNKLCYIRPKKYILS